jgi:hypothetical protein
MIAIPGGCGDGDGPDGTGQSVQLSALFGKNCQLQIDREWIRPDSSGPQYPQDELVEDDYQSVTDGPSYDVTFSPDGARVEVAPQPLPVSMDLDPTVAGDLESSSNVQRDYNLVQGSFAGGRFVVRTNSSAFDAELTLYGSGVPIVHSERGPLICDE